MGAYSDLTTLRISEGSPDIVTLTYLDDGPTPDEVHVENIVIAAEELGHFFGGAPIPDYLRNRSRSSDVECLHAKEDADAMEMYFNSLEREHASKKKKTRRIKLLPKLRLPKFVPRLFRRISQCFGRARCRQRSS